MAAPMVKTRSPGVYRRGSRYAYTWRDSTGKQRWGSARTYEDARASKAAVEKLAHTPGHLTLHEFLLEWVETYQGTGRRGFREETRREYESIIHSSIVPFFGVRVRLADVTGRDVARYIAHLCRQPNGRGGVYSDATVRNHLNPLRSAMASARAQGLILVDPTDAAQLPHRPAIDTGEGVVRALTRAQLEGVVEAAPQDWRLMLWSLAASGLRASELIGLDGRHVLDSGLAVRQRFRRGQLGAVKSRHASRDVPLAPELVAQLRELVAGPSRPLFRDLRGGRLDPDNVRNRVIKPAGRAAGVPWIGWHTFRHTHASLRFQAGDNIVTVQRVLGHHSPSFTLDTYVHLLADDIIEPLRL